MARKPRDIEVYDALPFLPKRYWLHVDHNVREIAFDREPDRRKCPTLTVDYYGDYEITRTYTIDAGKGLVRVRPRGIGWKLFDDRAGGHTVWKRQVE